jgi:hypothetical protein
MRSLIPVTLIGVCLLAIQAANSQSPKSPSDPETMDRVAATTYEHLATAIIEIEATEDDLVKSILIGYHAAARNHLRAAGTAEGQARKTHLEAAAAEITNIANEGDKRIQAIRQRLAKAGHTHNTDAETKEDYMFITNKEKKGLLALAQQAGRMDDQATQADIQALGNELASQFGRAIAPE